MKKESINTESNSVNPSSSKQHLPGSNAGTVLHGEDDLDNSESDISEEELELLDAAGDDGGAGGDTALTSQLDNTDEDGVPLEEKGFADDVTGEDLDVPGSEDDDYNEELGEEDEENNSYSKADTD